MIFQNRLPVITEAVNLLKTSYLYADYTSKENLLTMNRRGKVRLLDFSRIFTTPVSRQKFRCARSRYVVYVFELEPRCPRIRRLVYYRFHTSLVNDSSRQTLPGITTGKQQFDIIIGSNYLSLLFSTFHSN